MTAQISDRVLYGERMYALSGARGVGLFDPKQHGLSPVGLSSANARGWHCTYAVRDQRLRLVELFVCVPAGQTVTLDGREGVRDRAGRFDTPELHVSGLEHRIAFTGSMLIADGFIAALYLHLGFHPAWKYETVHELTFQAGALIEAKDRSAQLADVRRRIAESNDRGHPASREEIERWVGGVFDQRY